MQTRARILSIATAVPPYRLRQQDIAAAASRIFHSRNDFVRFVPVYEHAAIDTRYSCVPLLWYEKPSTLQMRRSDLKNKESNWQRRVAAPGAAGRNLE